ncbi:MAG: NAD kinase [Bacteroidetes bacterium]|nr:MAG: NAD kinase [Bacteroidota bacterium]REK04851.1 MAG: NAD kinase [Bacteroidota bacterium]REK36323.1 MAG: NAD kinase [Bacteroidota bacterium]REK51011.1 MAG: NAD kinase [Bacteroidota bacterium]
MNIAIYGRPTGEKQISLAKQVIDLLMSQHMNISLHSPYRKFLSSTIELPSQVSTFESHDDLPGKIDFLLSIGGDGTLLDTVLLVRDSGIPIAGINAGRLGFLSSVSEENLNFAIDSLLKGHYSLDSRTLLRLESNHPLFESNNIALNEFTLHKKETSSMITIHAYLNGEYLNSYWADGIMISTPTGSTGYSLSCGGPIVVPQSESFVITPIAPHNLNVRPIVVSDKNVISLEVEGRSQRFMATLDSRSATIDSSFQLAIRKENYNINLLRLSNENFLNTLRKKLNWGLDKRN